MDADAERIRALDIRFFDGPSDDPGKSPAELVSGPSAFKRLSHRRRLEQHLLFDTRSPDRRAQDASEKLLAEVRQARVHLLLLLCKWSTIEPGERQIRAYEIVKRGVNLICAKLTTLLEQSAALMDAVCAQIEHARAVCVEVLLDNVRLERTLQLRALLLNAVAQFGLLAVVQPPSQLAMLRVGVDQFLSRVPQLSGGDAVLKHLKQLGTLLKGAGNEAETAESADDCWKHFRCLLKELKGAVDQMASSCRFFPALKRGKPLRLLTLLGQGGFAECWTAIDPVTWCNRAVKLTRLQDTMSQTERQFVLDATCREVSLQRTLKNPYIVEMIECFEVSSSMFCAVLEQCCGGALGKLLAQGRKLPEGLASRWMAQILQALQYIHENARVVHADLKPYNVLINQGRLQVADFGLFRSLENTEPDLDSTKCVVGTIWYMPPEHLQACLNHTSVPVSAKFDIWSAGVVFYEMLAGHRPFTQYIGKASDSSSIAKAILRAVADPLEFPADTSDEAREFGKRLLNADLMNRPTATEALQIPYVGRFI